MSSGDQLLQKANAAAQKALSKSTFSFFGPSQQSKCEETRDIYFAAGNAFRLEKKMKESGDAFCLAGEMAIKAELEDDGASDYWNASKSYKRGYPDFAVAALLRCVDLLAKRGRLRQAADRQKDIAELYKQDNWDLHAALEAYERAAEWYLAEDSSISSNSCLKEAADIAASLDMYARAITNFEAVAAAQLQSPLTKYNVKEYYMKALFCYMGGGDIEGAQRAYERYTAADPSFATTREGRLCGILIDSVNNGDPDSFTAGVSEYDRLSKLDSWKTSILLKIKKGIKEEPSLV